VAASSLVVASMEALAQAARVSEAQALPDGETAAASAQEGVQKSQRTRPARQRIDALNSL
jgi:hypothetical protein